MGLVEATSQLFRGWQLNQQSAQSSVDNRRRRYDTRVVVEGAKADAALLPCQLHLGNVPGYTDWHSRVDPRFGTSVRMLECALVRRLLLVAPPEAVERDRIALAHNIPPATSKRGMLLQNLQSRP